MGQDWFFNEFAFLKTELLQNKNNYECLCLDINPDILVSAKVLGGGKASISGYIASEKI